MKNADISLIVSAKPIHCVIWMHFAVEERDNPSFKGKPVVVARTLVNQEERSVVSTLSFISTEIWDSLSP